MTNSQVYTKPKYYFIEIEKMKIWTGEISRITVHHLIDELNTLIPTQADAHRKFLMSQARDEMHRLAGGVLTRLVEYDESVNNRNLTENTKGEKNV